MPGTSTTPTNPLLDLLFEDPAVGRCLVAPDGSVLRVNGEWLRSTGLALDHVLGADVVDLFPETRDMALALHARARAGHHVHVPPHAQRVRGRETWWEGTIDPVPMEGGVGLLVTAREIARPAAARRDPGDAAARAAGGPSPRELEERFRVLTEAMPQIVCVLAADGNVEYVNGAWTAFSGMDLAATARAGWDRVLHPDDLAVARACRVRALRSLGPEEVELRYRGADGSHRWFLSRLAPVVERGRVVRFVGAAMDITARKEAEEALREAGRRKDEFLGMLSHELRNPLAPIRNSVYVLRNAGDPERIRRAQDVIDRQTEHLTRLVDDLLDVTRIARGKIALRRERVDLREVVRRTAEDLRALLEDRRVSLHVDLPDERLWTLADPTRVAQVVGNLLQNSAKFTLPGDEVRVALRDGGDFAELEVADTGAGIDAALLPHVFEPFVQADRTLARTQGGLGLGLALVKGIVELHGGTVRAESGGRGRGTTVRARLPVTEAVSERAHSGAARRGDGVRRVLVVDDEPDGADSLAEVVGLLGHEAAVAYDGAAAVAKARDGGFDVVLCDIGLPGMDGYEVARRVRASCAGVRLVAVTGYAQPEDRARAEAAGFDAHLAKPASPEELARAIEGAPPPRRS